MDEVTTRPTHCKDRAKTIATGADAVRRLTQAEPPLPDFQSERADALQLPEYALLTRKIADIRQSTGELLSVLAMSWDATGRHGHTSDYRALMISTQKAMALMFGCIQQSLGDLYAVGAQYGASAGLDTLSPCEDSAVDVENALLAMAALAHLRVGKDGHYQRQMEAGHQAVFNAAKRFDTEISALRRRFAQKARA
jgi:hypothetical protein